MSALPRMALVIPVYNFAHGIEDTLNRLSQWSAAATSVAIQVLFVDDGSSDGTAELIARHLASRDSHWRLLRNVHNQGKGHAVRSGIAAAWDFAPDIIVFSDCDLYYGLDIILERMLPLLHQADIVIIDRTLTRRDTAVPLRRRVASAMFNRLVAILTGIHFKDTQAGLKGFRAQTCRPLFEVLTLQRFAFDVELLSVALHHQFRIEQLPIESLQSPADQFSTVSMLPASLQMFADLLQINRNWKAGRYQSPALQDRLEAKIYAITDD
jgi:glycosyltransferase involved in cell wall biosynthesis